MNQQKG